MSELTSYSELYKEFCDWSPDYAKLVTDYRPWGNMSIVVWLSNGQAYKVKRQAPNRFTMQLVSKADIDKKLGI